MYREEVITKALREHKDKLGAALAKNRNRQKELLLHIEEGQLSIRTLDSMVKGMGQGRPQAAEIAQTTFQSTPVRTSVVTNVVEEVRPAEQQPPTYVRQFEKKGMGRDRLKSVAFPFITSRFSEEPFEVSKVRDLLDELEPEVSHTYEAAWNLCNDLLREGKLRQAGLKRLPKGIVRLFMLKPQMNNRPSAQTEKGPPTDD